LAIAITGFLLKKKGTVGWVSSQKMRLIGFFCHKAIDIHDPVRNTKNSGFLPEERDWMSRYLDSGFIDTFRHYNQDPHNYTWWSYRVDTRSRNLGWRIDYQMVSHEVGPQLLDAAILPIVNHSDHCPTLLEMDF